MLAVGSTPLLQGYIEQNRSEIERVFEQVGLARDAAQSLETAVAATQPWVKGDHGHQSYVFSLTPGQKIELSALYEELDMVGGRDLPCGDFDTILVFGAVHLGNDKRVAYLKKMLERKEVHTNRIVLLGGERSLFPEREPADVERTVCSIRTQDKSTAWMGAILEKYPRITETDMLRLAALDHLGPSAVRASSIHLHVGEEKRQETNTPITHYNLGSYRSTPISLMHSRARLRKDGDSRHTTESCAADWAIRFQPPENARVAMIGSQPHLERMVATVGRALRTVGRGDISLVVGGPSTTHATGHTIYLGEIARNLYEQQLSQGEGH